MIHSFDTEIAAKYGVVEAVLIDHLAFWIRKNKANGKNAYSGRYWTYNSLRAYGELFPYLTTKQLRRALQKLIQESIIMDGNFNKSPYDRTKWYTFTDKGMEIIGETFWADTNDQEEIFIIPNEEIDLPKRENVNAQKGQPIPDTKPSSYTNIETGTLSSSNARETNRGTNRGRIVKSHKEYTSGLECVRNCNVCEIWNDNFFPITDKVAHELESLVREFGEGAVKYGLEIAVENNVKTIAYVKACARNYDSGLNFRDCRSKKSCGNPKNDVQGTYEKLMQKYAGGAFDND